MRNQQEETEKTMESLDSIVAVSMESTLKRKISETLLSAQAEWTDVRPQVKWAIAASLTALALINWYVISSTNGGSENAFAETYFSYMKSI